MNIIEDIIAHNEEMPALNFTIFVPTKNKGMVVVASASGDADLCHSCLIRVLQGYYWAEQKGRLYRDEFVTDGVAGILMVDGTHQSIDTVGQSRVFARGSDYLEDLPGWFGETLPNRFEW